MVHYLEEALITTSPLEENLIAFPTKLTNIYWNKEPNIRECVVVKPMSGLKHSKLLEVFLVLSFRGLNEDYIVDLQRLNSE